MTPRLTVSPRPVSRLCPLYACPFTSTWGSWSTVTTSWAMIRPTSSPCPGFRTTGTPHSSARYRVDRRTAYVGGTAGRGEQLDRLPLGGTQQHDGAGGWLIQVWRTCLKRPGSYKSVHLLKESVFVHVGALFRRARVGPSRSLAGRGGTSAASMPVGVAAGGEVHLATNEIGLAASQNHATETCI